MLRSDAKQGINIYLGFISNALEPLLTYFQTSANPSNTKFDQDDYRSND